MTRPRVQFVWWWTAWSRPRFHRWTGSLAAFLNWSFSVGPLEVRRWRS